MSEFEKYHSKHNPPISLDELHSFRSELKKFMQQKVVDRINDWDVILTKNRKGTIIFYDLVNRENIPPEILQITDYTIHKDLKNIAGKKLLLFDDSIKSGDTLLKLISTLNSFEPKSISVVSLLVKKPFELNFQGITNIEPIFWKETEEFTQHYVSRFKYYLDCLCMPQKKDLIVEVVHFPRKLSENDVIKLLTINEIEPQIEPENSDNGLKCPNCMLLYHDFLEQNYTLNYIEKKDNEIFLNTGTRKWKLDQLKIRFFVHFTDSSTNIYIEYIVHPLREVFNGCEPDFKYYYKECGNNNPINSENCLICFTYNMYKMMREIVIPQLMSKGNYKCVKLLPCCIKGKIIDEDSFTT